MTNTARGAILQDTLVQNAASARIMNGSKSKAKEQMRKVRKEKEKEKEEKEKESVVPLDVVEETTTRANVGTSQATMMRCR